MRDAFKSHGLAQALALLEELAEFAFTQGAKRQSDSSQQQKGARQEVAFHATLWRLRWRLLVVFFDALD
jgi:hypothetical protein